MPSLSYTARFCDVTGIMTGSARQEDLLHAHGLLDDLTTMTKELGGSCYVFGLRVTNSMLFTIVSIMLSPILRLALS